MTVWCKDCVTEGVTTYREPRYAGPRCATHSRAFKKAQQARRHETHVGKVYGLGPGEYDRLKAFQGGKCAICRRATGASRALSVDHDHVTGQVRGCLCRPCNSMLGHARDDTRFFERTIAYLVYSPYAAMKDGRSPDHDGET